MRSINEELKNDVAYAIEHTPLPKWIISAITYRAYEDGHAYGEDEVNGKILGLLNDFEEAYKKSNE